MSNNHPPLPGKLGADMPTVQEPIEPTRPLPLKFRLSRRSMDSSLSLKRYNGACSRAAHCRIIGRIANDEVEVHGARINTQGRREGG